MQHGRFWEREQSLLKSNEGLVLSYAWACGPPIDMKKRLSGACTLMERGRHRSVYTLDEARPFLSLIRNARFEPICVAPLLGVGGMVARDGV
jgi:hypothetical protein